MKLIEEAYRWLPLGSIVNNRILIVHGGISDTTDLDLIKSLDRGKVSYPSCNLVVGKDISFMKFVSLLFIPVQVHPEATN